MDEHEICRAYIRKVEAERDEAIEREADLELDLSEKNELIASLSAEIMRLMSDRTYTMAL